jgi:LCCL domain-containing protein
VLRFISAAALVLVVAACGPAAPPAGSITPTHSAPTGAEPTATDGGAPTQPAGSASGDVKTCSPGWTTTAQNCSIHVGDTLMVSCPPGGTIRYAWGTDTYTADSSVCTAAVHAGLIGVDAGGDVYLEVTAGLEEYAGSERNGVKTQARGEWLTSFMFVDAPTQ